MANMKKMMKQAADMQKKMVEMQDQLGDETVEFAAAGGMVSAVATCSGSLKALSINPQLIDPEEKELLEDAIVAAVAGALTAAREKADGEMSKITAGMGIPGLGI